MTTIEIFWRLLIANACGAIIGINRDLHHKSAGFRTISMVCVGSAIVALIIEQMSPDPNAASRVVQGVVTGVGFLGAGVILHPAGSNRVAGLTTAASIWLTAGLGIACGLGQYRLVGAGAAVTLWILLIGKPIEKMVERFLLHRDGRKIPPTLESGPPQNTDDGP